MFRFLKGGQLVGAAMKGRRVLVIDDVITAGKAQALSRAATPWHVETHTASCKQFLFIFIVGVHVHVRFLSALRSTIQYSIYLYSSLLSTYFIVLHIPLPLFLSLFYFCTGTAIRESVDILNAAGAILVAVAVSLDRQEKATDTATESAIQVRHRRRSERKGKEGREGMSRC